MGIVSTITEQEQHEVFVGGCSACRSSTGVWSRTHCCAHSSCQDCGSETRGSENYSSGLQLHLLLLPRKKLQLLKQSVRSVKLNLKLILKPTPGILPMDIMPLLLIRHQKLRLLRLKPPLLSITALSIHTPMDTMDTLMPMLDILDILLSMDMGFHSLQLPLLLLPRKKLQLLKQSVRNVKLNLKLILKLTPGILPMDIMLLLFTRHQKLRLLRLKPLLSITALSIHTPMDTMDMDIHMPILDTTTHTLMDIMLSLPSLLRRLRLLLSLRGRDVMLMLRLRLIPLFLHLTAEFSILLP